MTNGLPKRRPARIARVLVPLASSASEYRHAYAFLREAFAGLRQHEVRIRPHPEFTLEEILGRLAAPHDAFYRVSRGPLAEDLAWADAVVYASSTVSVEALSLGIPVVRLEFGEALGTDPLSEWHGRLKWSARKPSELIEAFGRIAAVSEQQFAVWQEEAQAYARRYLRPVTEERLRAFLEA
jgi:hypothetical protein